MTEQAWPEREITDPRMLRALAHPVRLKLLNTLILSGPATATELAERIDDTPANCSWHLRQLAKFGFIEEAEGGSGRNRPWRHVPVGNRWGNPDDPPELAEAGREVLISLLGYELAELRAFEARKAAEPLDWQDASFTSQSFAWLTVEELAEVRDLIMGALLRHAERFTDPETRPADARPIRFVAWGIPAE